MARPGKRKAHGRLTASNKTAANYRSWERKVLKKMKDDYGLSKNDVDQETLQSGFDAGDKPDEFIEWYAEKYDLTSAGEYGGGWMSASEERVSKIARNLVAAWKSDLGQGDYIWKENDFLEFVAESMDLDSDVIIGGRPSRLTIPLKGDYPRDLWVMFKPKRGSMEMKWEVLEDRMAVDDGRTTYRGGIDDWSDKMFRDIDKLMRDHKER